MVKKTSKMVIALILSASMVLGNAVGTAAAEPNTQIGIDAVELDAETEDEISINIEDDDEEDSIAEDFSDEIEIEDATAEESLEIDIMDDNAEDSDEEPEVNVTAEGGATEVVASGSCGPKTNWTLSKDADDKYYLDITGSGMVNQYNPYNGTSAPWSTYATKIVSLTLSDDISYIGNYAFYFCSFSEVTLPSKLTQIGEGAFGYCMQLRKCDFPSGLISVSNMAFSLVRLDNLVIPASLTNIGDNQALPACKKISVAKGNPAFDSRNDCNGVIRTSKNSLFRGSDSLEIPDGIVEIEYGALYDCRDLRQIHIPKSLTMIGDNKHVSDIFYYIENLESITVDKENPIFDSRNGCNALISTKENCLLVGGSKSSIPEGVVEIGKDAFSGSKGLKEIVIPNSVTKIGDSAFSSCEDLEEIFIPDSVTSLGKNVFVSCSLLSTVTGMKGLKTIPELTFSNCRIRSIDLPEGIEKIEARAFEYQLDDDSMLAVKFPKSLKDIAEKSFPSNVKYVYYAGNTNEWLSVNNLDQAIKLAEIHYNSPTIPKILPVERFELDLESYEIEQGKFAVLSPRVWPTEVTDEDITWTSSNTNVATVDATGKVVAHSLGEAEITATTQGGAFKDSCAIKVVKTFVDDAEYQSILPAVQEEYLEKTESGYFTVAKKTYYQSGKSISKIFLHYLDSNLNFLYKKIVPDELPLWGGFKATDDAYYIVTGQNNNDESKYVECFRITKYDHNWNRLGSAGFFDCNTTIPFRAGACRMDVYGNLMVIRTCHQMYTSTDGLRHQANVSIILDTDVMRVVHSETAVRSDSCGYVSHSFNQYVVVDEEGRAIFVDHGDGHPRASVLFKTTYLEDIVSRGVRGVEPDSIHILEFKGKIGDNYTGAYTGGLAIGNNKYLVVGNSVVQDENWDKYKTRNVFVSSVNKDLSDQKITWLTNFNEGGTTTDTPCLVKVNGNRFIVFWNKGDKLCYAEVDENGNPGTTYEKDAKVDCCNPILDGSRILWFTTDIKGIMTLYSLSTGDLSNLIVKKMTPPEFKGIKIDGADSRTIETGSSDEIKVIVDESGATVKNRKWSSSDTAVLTVEGNGNGAKVKAIKSGRATITADFDGKKASVQYEVVEKIIRITEMSWSSEVTSKIKDSKLELDEKDAFKLKVVTNQGANEKVIYSSDNTGVATVDGSGLLKAVKKGETKITARSASGKVSISLNIKVNGVLTDLDNENIILEEPDVKPEDVDDNNNKLWIAGVKKNYSYAGTAIKPTVRVYSGTTLLRENTEYTLSYKQNTNVGNQATIIVKGKGSYGGRDSRTSFTIDPVNISKDDNISAYTDAKGKIFVYWNGTLLKDKKDYTVNGKTISGIGNFVGTVNLSDKAATLVSLNKAVVTVPKSVVYSGCPAVLGHANAANNLVVRAAKNSEPLKYGVDYTVRYETNVNKGKAYVTIIGQQKAGYTGQKKVSFNISPFDIATTTKSETAPHIKVSMASSYAYEKDGAMPQPTVRFINGSNKWTLREGVDYTLTYKNNKKIGNAAYVVITGKGNFSGKLTQKFTVEGKDIAELYAFAADKTFNSKKKGSYYYSVPAIYDANGKTLGNNKDFKVINYLANGKSIGKKDSVANGTVITAVVEGKGFYSGKCEVSYKVTNAAKDISKAKVAISKQTYTGNPLTPELKVTYGKTDTLKKDVDYRIVGYYNNTKKGTARVVIEGIGSYSGSKVQSFTIGSRSIFF